MEYIGIGICVIAVLAICMFIIQRKKNNPKTNASANLKTDAEKHEIAVSDDAPTELIIGMDTTNVVVIRLRCFMPTYLS